MSVIKQTRFTEKQLESINRYAEVKGYSVSEAIRTLCQKGLEIEVSNDNINLIVEIIDERLRAILRPQVERLASISAKGAIMSATSTFLNAQALADFVPVGRRRDVVEVYEKSRLKGVAYVKGRISEYEMDVKEVYKEKD